MAHTLETMHEQAPTPASPRRLISVVIPAFNACGTLAETLDSVLAQSHENFEVLVIDDGSTDSTPAVLARYGDRVRVVRQANRGLPAARNAGCDHARGEFIALMDADDVCEPERIAVQAAVLDRFPQAVLCSSDFSAFDETGVLSASHAAAYYSAIGDAPAGFASLYPHSESVDVGAEVPGCSAKFDVRWGRVYPELAFGNFVHPPTVMFRRDVLAAAGPFDTSLLYTCDWEWFVRMARAGPFLHVPRALLRYRISRSQMSSWHVSGSRVAVDVVRAAEKIWADDPALVAANRSRVRNCRRAFYLDAAYALSQQHRTRAAAMLAVSVRNGERSMLALTTALRLLTPARLLRFATRVRSRLRAARALP